MNTRKSKTTRSKTVVSMSDKELVALAVNILESAKPKGKRWNRVTDYPTATELRRLISVSNHSVIQFALNILKRYFKVRGVARPKKAA